LHSPVDVPFVKEEPFLGLGQVDVDILVDTADHENLVIVSDWLGAEEFLRLSQRAFHALNFTNLGVKCEAVGNPAIVTTKDHDLRVIKREAAHGVAC